MGFFEVFAAALAGFYGLIKSYGFAIILLTVAVRVVLLPLSIKQTRSMREMQRIQPELKAIQKKYKGDRQKMNEEMMALYKEHGVNPFGGCLPLLLQLPVLFALFYVIRDPLNYLKGALSNSALADALKEMPLAVHQFLGLRLDCTAGQFVGTSAPQSQAFQDLTCGDGSFSFIAIPYLVLIALMGFTTWYQQKQMQAKSTSSGDLQAQQMKMMGRIMPVMLMYFAYTFPTGVVLYWLTTNLWTIGQQRLMLQVAPPVTPKTPAPAATKPALGNGDPPPRTNSKPHPSSKKKGKKR